MSAVLQPVLTVAKNAGADQMPVDCIVPDGPCFIAINVSDEESEFEGKVGQGISA